MLTLENMSTFGCYLKVYFKNELFGLARMYCTTTSEPNSSLILTYSTAGELNCISCGLQTSGAHKCPRCYRSIHFICGRPAGEEGYGSSMWCPRCDLAVKRDKHEVMRVGIKRKQDVLHKR